MARLTLALIGAGRQGQRLLGSLDPQACELRWFAGRRATSELRFASATYTNDLDLVFSDPAVEAILIATPAAHHFELAKRALLAGKHVFLEKPGAESASQALELVRLAARQRRVLRVNYMLESDPVFAALETRVRAELARGRAIHARFSWQKLGTFTEDVVSGLLVHDLHMAIRLFGELLAIERVRPGWMWSPLHQLRVVARFGSNAEVEFEIDRAWPGPRLKSIAVNLGGDEGLVWQGRELSRVGADGGSQLIASSGYEEPLRRALSAFVAQAGDPEHADYSVPGFSETLAAVERVWACRD